jgi:hypothetical protein
MILLDTDVAIDIMRDFLRLQCSGYGRCRREKSSPCLDLSHWN